VNRFILIADYRNILSGIGVTLEESLGNYFNVFTCDFLRKSNILRGISLFFQSFKFNSIVIVCDSPGCWLFMFLLNSFSRKKKVILLEFIRREPSGSIRKLIYPFWFKFIVNPVMNHVVLEAQVMTHWEIERYSKIFNLPRSMFRFIPWPFGDFKKDAIFPSKNNSKQLSIVSSGRQSCDWVTLSRAALGRSWPLTIACSRRDFKNIKKLKWDKTVNVICEIPFSDHQSILSKADIYVMSMRETVGSSGHVRLSNAVGAGVAVVATRIKSFEDYVIENETALIVENQDWQDCREKVERLIRDKDLRDRIRFSAYEHAKSWLQVDYASAIREMVMKYV
jgi:hypothetical protein